MSRDEEIFNSIQSTCTQLLLAANNPTNQEAYNQANQQILQYEEQAWPMWITALVLELADEQKPELSRQTAGIYFRRCLTKNVDLMATQMVWSNVPTAAKDAIKQKLLDTMSTCKYPLFSKLAAEAISKVAFLELGKWQEFIPLMCSWITGSQSTDQLKETSLIALREVCQDVVNSESDELLTPYSNYILNSIQACLISENEALVKSALNALEYAIGVFYESFNDQTQRQLWISALLKCTKSSNDSIRVAALQCLAEFIPAIYQYLNEVISHIFERTIEIIKTDTESVVKMAIEFWTALAEYEEARVDSGDELSRGLLPSLPIFLECLERPQDLEDNWTVNAAASTCISRLAYLVRDDIVQPVISWIEVKIQDPNPLVQAGAIFAFGSIVEGPDGTNFCQYVSQAIPLMLQMVSVHQNNPDYQVVLHQIFWTFTRVAQYQPFAFTQMDLLKAFLECLCMQSQQGSPTITSFACEALDSLFQYLPKDSNNPINPYMTAIMESLMHILTRPDAEEENMRIYAFEAIITLIKIIPDEQSSLIEKTVLHLAPQLLQTTCDTGSVHEIQSGLCGILAACARSLGPRIQPVAKDMIMLFFTVLRSTSRSNVHKECFMAISALIGALQEYFAEYVPELIKYLVIALKNWQDEELCRQAVYVVSDLALSLPEAFHSYAMDILEILLNNLKQSPSPVLAPKIILSFSDISNALPEGLGDMFVPIMEVLRSASEIAITPINLNDDPEKNERIQEWREAVLGVYTIIILNMGSNQASILQSNLNSIISLIKGIISDPECSDSINKAVCSLIHDLSSHFGSQLTNFVKADYITEFIEKCLKSSSEKTVQAACETKAAISRL